MLADTGETSKKRVFSSHVDNGPIPLSYQIGDFLWRCDESWSLVRIDFCRASSDRNEFSEGLKDRVCAIIFRQIEVHCTCYSTIEKLPPKPSFLFSSLLYLEFRLDQRDPMRCCRTLERSSVEKLGEGPSSAQPTACLWVGSDNRSSWSASWRPFTIQNICRDLSSRYSAVVFFMNKLHPDEWHRVFVC